MINIAQSNQRFEQSTMFCNTQISVSDLMERGGYMIPTALVAASGLDYIRVLFFISTLNTSFSAC